MSTQLDRLIVQLQGTDLRSKDVRTYQFLEQLVKFLQGVETQLSTRIQTNSDVGSSKTFLTSTNEVPTLPNSRELVAGTNITFDDTVPGEKILNVPSMSTPPGGVDKDLQYNNAGAFGGSSLKQINPNRIDLKNGVNPQEFRLFNTESGGGADYELIKLLGEQLDIFSEPCFDLVTDSAGAGVGQGIELKTVANSISFRISGANPTLILYHDPTSNGGISLIPNGSGFIGTIFCDQSGSLMWTPGGFAVPHMIDLLTMSVKALIIGHGAAGADFAPRYLGFNTVNSQIEVGMSVAGNGASICFIPDAATNKVIANLPAAPPKGSILWVNDALAPVIGNVVAAGGTAFALCCFNGTNWRVIGV